MLVLTRREHQIIVIQLPNGSEIQIRVRQIRGKFVSLGITAPQDVNIVRSELERRASPNDE